MNLFFYPALATHILFGTLAIAMGVAPILVAKGGDIHRRFGGRYRQCMVFVLGSAVVMTLLALKPYFAALTIGAGISTFSGLRVLRRKRPDRNPAERAQPIDWIVALAALVLSILLMVLVGSTGGAPKTVYYSLLSAAAVYAAYDLWRFAAPAAWPFFPRLWFYEHLVKMLASYSAVLAAFSGSVLTFLPIPDPWKQLWSTILFHNLMIGFILWYALIEPRRRRSRTCRA